MIPLLVQRTNNLIGKLFPALASVRSRLMLFYRLAALARATTGPDSARERRLLFFQRL